MKLNRRSRLPGEAGPPHPEASRPLSGRPLKCRWVGADTEAPATLCSSVPSNTKTPFSSAHRETTDSASPSFFPHCLPRNRILDPQPFSSQLLGTFHPAPGSPLSLRGLQSPMALTHSTNAQEHGPWPSNVTFAEMRMTLNSEGCWPSSSKKGVKIDSATLKVSS